MPALSSLLAGFARAERRPDTAKVVGLVSGRWSGLLQGAEDYLRYVVRRPGFNRETAQQTQEALNQWDAQRSAH